MKILLDECIPFDIYNFLKESGFFVKHVSDTRLSGCTNGKVFKLAKEEFQLFITNDRHFKNKHLFPPNKNLGVIFIRVDPSLPEMQLNAFKKFLKNTTLENCVGKLSIIRR